MINIDNIWQGWSVTQVGGPEDGGYTERARNRRLQKRRDQLHALKIVNDVEPGLLFGKAEISLNIKQTEDIFEKIIEDLSGDRLKGTHNFLVRGLTRGVEQKNWKMSVSAPMIYIHRDSSPFRPSQFHKLQSLNCLSQAFEVSLEDSSFFEANSAYCRRANFRTKNSSVTAQQLHAGQIIFSAIVNGALLNSAWLACLGDALSNRLVIDEELIWMDLIEVSKKKKEEEEEEPLSRRWFPDPLTSLLILCWRKQYGAKWIPCENSVGTLRQNTQLLNQYLKALGIKTRPSVPQLIVMAETRLSILLPRYLVQYAKKRQSAPSLPASSWFRFRSNQRLDLPTVAANKEQAPELCNRHYQRQNQDAYPNQQKKYKQIRAIFSQYHHKYAPKVAPITQAVEALLTNDQGISPLLEVVTLWSLVMMRSEWVTGSKLKPSSAARYISSIGPALMRNAVEYDIQKFDSEDWLSLYEKVIESVRGARSRNFKTRRLQTFHRFLVVQYNVPIVELETIGGVEKRVDSNIISGIEYENTLARISQESSLSVRHRKMLRLLVIIGFRCGLRRNEVLIREVVDLQGIALKESALKCANSRPELIVRNNRYGILKTIKSPRRSPLSALLTAAELNELFEWQQLRVRELAGQKIKHQLLFCRQGADNYFLTDRESFSLIHQAIRAVTCDFSLHFHHLRHSGANQMFLRLLDDDYPGIAAVEWGQPNQPEKSLRAILLAQTELQPTKKMLYAISQSLGHIDPKESIDTYFHFFDLALGHVLKTQAPELSLQIQANLLGVTPNSLKIFRNRQDLKGRTIATDLLAIQLRRYEKMLRDPLYKASKPAETFTVTDSHLLPASYIKHLPSPFLLYAVFKQRYEGMSVKSISQRYDYSHSEISEWLDRAKKLAAIQTGRGCSRSIPKQEKDWKRTELPAVTILLGYCPALPHSLDERKLADRICSRLIDVHQHLPDWVEAGLRLYLMHTTTSHTAVKFHRSDDVKYYVAFLRKAGVPIERIKVSVCPSVVSKSPSNLKFWVKHLSIPKENITRLKLSESSETARSRVWISVPSAEDYKKLQGRTTGTRFGLYMAAIVLGIDFQPIEDKSQLNEQLSLIGSEMG